MRVLSILGISLAGYWAWVVVSYMLQAPIPGIPLAQTFAEYGADIAGVAMGRLPDLAVILLLVTGGAFALRRINHS